MELSKLVDSEVATMKKTYETPAVEVVKFEYKDQVVAASGATCSYVFKLDNTVGAGSCNGETPTYKTSIA
jgi:predicted lipoprotein with Yx(FWY)xxD motif